MKGRYRMDKFEEKLKNWYGKTLDRCDTRLLVIDEEENEIFAKVYMVAEEVEGVKRVDFVRIFSLGEIYQISIDLKIDDLNDLENIRRIVEYSKGLTGDVIPF
jgi:hypothetical protein